MSYDLIILKDNPVGYWSFNGTANDLTSSSNNAVLTSASYTTPPIIANSGSSLKITSGGSASISNSAGRYEVLSKNFENNTFTIAFWFSLNNLLNGSGYGTTPYVSNQLNLIQIRTGTTTVGKIYYDYLSNTIRFNIVGSGNTDAYYVVDDLDKQYYVVATISNLSTSINVNFKNGVNGSLSNRTVMSSGTKTNLNFLIDGSSLTSKNFLISSLAFFKYALSPDQIRGHIVWAGNNDKPVFQSKISSSISYIDTTHNPDNFGYTDTISGENFSRKGSVTNLSANKNGLQPINVDQLSFNKIANSTASYTNGTNGIQITNNGGIDFIGAYKYFNINTNLTISAQVLRTTVNRDYIFSINGVEGKYFYLETASFGSPASIAYALKYYDSLTETTASLLYLNGGTISSLNTNVIVNFNSQNVTLYASGQNVNASATVLTSASPSFFPLNLSTQSVITIGNSYNDPQISTASIKNFGITNVPVSSFAAFDYTSASTFLIKFTNTTSPFIISQYGYWEYVIPSINYPTKELLGSVFDWTTMDNCKVSLSTNSGSTYTTITRQQPITSYDLTGTSKNINIKVEITTDYTLDGSYQSFNNLYYNFYTDLQAYSDNELYLMTPASSKSLANYIFSGNTNILARPENFGVKFYGDSSKAPGYANIQVPKTYNAIEMWYRPDNILSGSLNYLIVDSSGSASDTSLWLNASGRFAFNSSPATLYINGVSVSTNTYTASANELYHIIYVPNTPTGRNGNLFLNGTNLGFGAVSGSATYGLIQFWNVIPGSTTASLKYLSYVGKNTLQQNDGNTSKIFTSNTVSSVSIFNLG